MNRILLAFLLALLASPAFAHVGHGGGFHSGFLHPMTGADHVLAMIAVGLWAAMRGQRAILAWPLAFVLAMLAGFGLAQFGFVVPKLELMILSTVMALGAVIALGLNAPIIVGAAAIALAGLAHGFAHGSEVYDSLLPFAAGFSLSTALLHAAGLGIAFSVQHLSTARMARILGLGIMAAGAALAFS